MGQGPRAVLGLHPVCGPPVPAASSGLQVVELEKPLPGTVGMACPHPLFPPPLLLETEAPPRELARGPRF